MVNPATWSEELLVTLHREVLLLPGTKGMSDVASGLTDALIIAGMPMGYEESRRSRSSSPKPAGASRSWTVTSPDRKRHRPGQQRPHPRASLDLVGDVPAGRDYQSLIQARR